MKSRIIRFETNTLMRKLLKDNQIDLLTFSPSAISRNLKRYLNIQFVEKGQYYTYKGNHVELFWNDDTGNEFSNNKVVIKINSIKKSLNDALSFAYALCKVLVYINSSFRVFISFDDSFYTISFFQIRSENTFFDDDLDSYEEEAILLVNIMQQR
ncbi:MAG: hypothetical protein E7108_08485 [Bacteroidales bacterium]|jgi:hypothetical protein|nr:hypothetical protein [Bacteroidales bacterium]